jgi:hypothetical protein
MSAQRCDVDNEDRPLVSSILARLVSRHCQHGPEWWTLGSVDGYRNRNDWQRSVLCSDLVLAD